MCAGLWFRSLQPEPVQTKLTDQTIFVVLIMISVLVRCPIFGQFGRVGEFEDNRQHPKFILLKILTSEQQFCHRVTRQSHKFFCDVFHCFNPYVTVTGMLLEMLSCFLGLKDSLKFFCTCALLVFLWIHFYDVFPSSKTSMGPWWPQLAHAQHCAQGPLPAWWLFYTHNNCMYMMKKQLNFGRTFALLASFTQCCHGSIG